MLPIKAHYATLAMLSLARHFNEPELLSARTIAEEQAIPNQFLGQILQQLRGSGLITSTRGSSGGFRLSRNASQISVSEIVEAVCPGVIDNSAVLSSASSCCVQEVWLELAQRQHEFLAGISLSELVMRANRGAAAMFYI